MEDLEKQEKVEALILSYLERQPNAGDTLEGITKWWLEMERIEVSVDQVAAACENLKKLELLETFEGPSGANIYRLKFKI